MTMLKSGWIIVGSTPSTDGTTKTKGPGCLLVFDSNGTLATVWSGSHINGPWGNMAVVDNGATATLFISMSGYDLPGPDKLDETTGQPVIVDKATVLRVNLAIPPSGPPKVKSQTVIASGFGERADKDVFLIGPTGLALIGSTLYVSDAVENRIVAIPDALTRTGSAGTGKTVTKGGMLQRALALVATPEGHILCTNGKNGQVVEFDPASGKQLAAQWIDNNQAQQPPGNGDLFGLAIAPDGGFYYVEDDTNMLAKAAP
jgi:DNA-binding beta-propeller fold protein YncE